MRSESLTGHFHPIFLSFFVQRAEGEKFVPAGYTAKGGHAQSSPDHRRESVHMLGCDALQRLVSANRATRMEETERRLGGGAEPVSAGRTPPRQAAQKRSSVVK
jgi:hypothetical protein